MKFDKVQAFHMLGNAFVHEQADKLKPFADAAMASMQPIDPGHGPVDLTPEQQAAFAALQLQIDKHNKEANP